MIVFAHMPEKLVTLTTRIPEPLRKKIRAKAVQRDLRLEQYIKLLFEAGMKALDAA